MEHQDWNNITLNNPHRQQKIEHTKEIQKKVSNRQFNPETTKLEPPKNLGKEIAQARTSKGINQDTLAIQSGISKQLINKWEANKEVPSNAEIAKLEKCLGIKLPRCKKVKVQND